MFATISRMNFFKRLIASSFLKNSGRVFISRNYNHICFYHRKLLGKMAGRAREREREREREKERARKREREKERERERDEEELKINHVELSRSNHFEEGQSIVWRSCAQSPPLSSYFPPA
jgi:hypothetical protein